MSSSKAGRLTDVGEVSWDGYNYCWHIAAIERKAI